MPTSKYGAEKKAPPPPRDKSSGYTLYFVFYIEI